MNKEEKSAILILVAVVAAVASLIWWADRDTPTVEEAKQGTLAEIKTRVETGVRQAKVDENERLQLEEEKQWMEQKRQRLERDVMAMKAIGAIHSVDVGMSEVRIDPSVWMHMDVDEKQLVVMFFSQYFEASGRPGQVTVLSNRNDTKLAKYSVWSGVKIYQ